MVRVAQGTMPSRRSAILGGLTLGSLALIGCTPPSGDGNTSREGQLTASSGTDRKEAMTVYRDPNCGCCEAWAELARKAGYDVRVIDQADMAAVKQRFGVPAQLASCHTAVAAVLAFEGHVPLDAVARLLRERPAGVRGLAVPGMPIGSPGMEAPDGSREPYDVLAFDAAGQTTVFARQPA